MKLLTICVPCYNSQDYMEKCLNSVLEGGDRIEVLIIDDGSTDKTGEIADRYEKEYPGIVKAIHKANGGHGSGVNTGIDLAEGMFYKVVDSDDWLEKEPYLQVLDKLEDLMRSGKNLDLMICNYTYAKVGVPDPKVIRYDSALPVDQVFGWDEVGHFHKGSYILMHSAIYRTEMLRECGMRLPEHCFYVDNIYVFAPLPYVKDMYYMDCNLYQYFIGRADQSVNEDVMISRLDQQYRVTKIMIDYYTSRPIRERMAKHKPLQEYMYNYLEIIVTISSVLAMVSNTPEHIKMKDELWDYIKMCDRKLYRRMRHGIFGTFVGSDAKGAKFLSVEGYKLVNHFFGFN